MASNDDVFNEEDGMEFEGIGEPNAVGATENDSQQQSSKEGKKTKGPYATHGIFSRSPWKALAKAGEDMKKMGHMERMLYEHFRPRDPFQEFYTGSRLVLRPPMCVDRSRGGETFCSGR
jgi:hypothetical protein